MYCPRITLVKAKGRILQRFMKILFTANRFPYPPYRGDKLKIFHLAKRLCRHHELHLVTFLQDKDDLQYLPELRKIFKEIHLVPLSRLQSYAHSLLAFARQEPFQVRYFYSAAMARMLRSLQERHHYDAVHVQHLRMAQYWAAEKKVPRILDLPDAFSLYWQRRVEGTVGPLRAFARLEYARVRAYERILGEFNLSLVCSREDQEYLRTQQGISNVQLLPNGVDLDTFSSPGHDYGQDKVILFTGNMDYAPNVDAVLYFAREIFPTLREQLPGVRFVVAGQRPVKKVRALAGPGITVTGFVPDLKEMYAAAAIVVAPLRFGAGTQNKVLEAMAMGVPVVSHEVGFSGLNIASGDGVLLAADAAAFRAHCLDLLRSEHLRAETGRAGAAQVRRQFDWEVVARQLEQYFQSLIKP